MKTRFSTSFRFRSALCWAILALGPLASAQTVGVLDLQLYAGLSITGAVDTVCSVEYVTDLAQTNSWRCLEFLQLPASPYVWADKSAPATGLRFYRAVEFAAPTNMVFIPPGRFRMGTPTNESERSYNEGPQTAVTISRGFWMGKYEVRQREYLAVIESNPSYFTGDSNRPVETVSWFDATNYCVTLTQRERAAGRIPANSVYRLPTEAEWEYACRAYTSTSWFFGEGNYLSQSNMWHDANSTNTTHPVGKKLPNRWGLYDMHGNVYEWCHDWWSDSLPGGIAVDPHGPATGFYSVVPGGYWHSSEFQCRSGYRYYYYPDFRFNNIGFRVVLAPAQPAASQTPLVATGSPRRLWSYVPPHGDRRR